MLASIRDVVLWRQYDIAYKISVSLDEGYKTMPRKTAATLRAFALIQGNPDASLQKRRSGPVTVRRLKAPLDLVTLGAFAEGDPEPIGTMTLPFDCMEIADAEWLRERAMRLPTTTLTLIR